MMKLEFAMAFKKVCKRDCPMENIWPPHRGDTILPASVAQRRDRNIGDRERTVAACRIPSFEIAEDNQPGV